SAGRVPATTEGRFRRGEAGAAAGRQHRYRRPGDVRACSPRRVRPAPQDAAQRAFASVRLGGDRGRRDPSGRTCRADRGRRFRAPCQFAPALARCSDGDDMRDATTRRACPLHPGSTYTVRMERSTDYAFDIDIDTRYLDEQSEPGQDRYVFAYTITIRNTGTVPARLLSRHWLITDATGKVQEVRGDGVVGEQPRLRPGEGFEYTSGAV